MVWDRPARDHPEARAALEGAGAVALPQQKRQGGKREGPEVIWRGPAPVDTALGLRPRGWAKARTNYVLQSTGATGGTCQAQAPAGDAQAQEEKT